MRARVAVLCAALVWGAAGTAGTTSAANAAGTARAASAPSPAASPASAGNVVLCNHFTRPVFFALAWRQGGVAYSRGWWSAERGRCIRIGLAAIAFYWRAETDSYRLPSGDNATTVWGDGGQGFCTEPKSYYFKSADGPCGRAPRKGFLRSWTRTDGIPIYQTVTINRDNTSALSVEAGHAQSLTPPSSPSR